MCTGVDLVNKIDDLLNELGISLKDFANKLEINPSTIATWKTKNIIPPVETLDKIATYLEISLEWLVTKLSFSSIKDFQRTVLLRRAIRKRIYGCLTEKTGVENADNNQSHISFFTNIPDLTYRLLYNWAEGRVNLNEYILQDIAYSLGVNIEYLIIGDENGKKELEKNDEKILETAMRNLNDLFCLDNLTGERKIRRISSSINLYGSNI